MHDLLVRTSRTFALAIPLLPEPTRGTVGLAYLLFRIADTLEDAERWSRDERLRGLVELAELLATPGDGRLEAVTRGWLERAPTGDAGYLELLAAVPRVLGEVARLPEGARSLVLGHAGRTVEGMRAALARADDAGRVRLLELSDLRAYCYVVAGIVGELLTAVFLLDAPSLTRVEAALREEQVAFGEGLQLVNILKDEAEDAADGRCYLPAGLPRGEVLALARADLRGARRYIEALGRGGAPPGFVAFTSLSAELAWLTLDALEREGPGAKVGRAEVFRLLAQVQARGEPPDAATARSGR